MMYHLKFSFDRSRGRLCCLVARHGVGRRRLGALVGRRGLLFSGLFEVQLVCHRLAFCARAPQDGAGKIICMPTSAGKGSNDR